LAEETAENIIEAKDLVFEYAKGQSSDANGGTSAVKALDGLDFHVRKGEFVAVIGKNGSGKSTLAKCLNALFVPESGDVLIKGMNTKDDTHLWDIRQTVGMVFQNPDNQIVSSIVEDDVAFGPENMGVPPETIKKRVASALEAVGMTELRRKSPHLLSGGQKQRVAIAGVIAMLPECIVFDEPTAMLDPSGRRDILEIIKDLSKSGITIVLITHFMDEAVQADRVILMEKGKVIKDAPPVEMFSDPKLLSESCMDPPVAVEIADELRRKGLNVPQKIVTEDALEEYLLALRPEQAGK